LSSGEVTDAEASERRSNAGREYRRQCLGIEPGLIRLSLQSMARNERLVGWAGHQGRGGPRRMTSFTCSTSSVAERATWYQVAPASSYSPTRSRCSSQVKRRDQDAMTMSKGESKSGRCSVMKSETSRHSRGESIPLRL